MVSSEYASVVQWIERQIPVLNVGGSSPFGRARKSPKRFVFTNFFGDFCFISRKCPETRPIARPITASIIYPNRPKLKRMMRFGQN